MENLRLLSIPKMELNIKHLSKIFHSCERICQLSITLLHETFLSEDDWLEVEKGVKRLSHLKVTGSVTPMTLAVLCRILK